MRERRWLLLALYGLLLATAVSGALKATRPKFKIATTSTTTTTTEEPDVADNENGEVEATTISSDVNATTSHTLTGIPQIDYIWDPNLPRELNGFNLSDYPFYSGIPAEINFKCDGLHDGFYASVPHKCQVYHHCLFGTRFDFLCANFTAFDQRTFICHFASEVDCANSKKFWHRNDALYKATETTTTSTSTTSTTTTTAAPPAQGGRRPGRPGRPGRPFRRRPVYDFYDEDYYDDDPGYERTRPRGYDRRDDYDYEDRKYTRRDRERDRDFRDRDYRDRDLPRPRDPDRPLRDSERPIKDDREAPLSPRERFPSRNNRRDPPRAAAPASSREPIDDEPRNPPIRSRDPLDDEPRSRNRDKDVPIRSRDPLDDEPRSRNRDKDAPIRSRDPLDDEPRSRNRDKEAPIRSRDPLDDEPRSRNRDKDAPIRSRDPLDDEPRSRIRDKDAPIRSRDPEDHEDDKKPLDSRNRDVDDRRYSEKGDDYEDEPAGPASSAGSELLVKPAAPASSVYARPRAPPKIRRPVPLAEQDKFAYKATSAPPAAGMARSRGPAQIPADDDYYEDEIEEVRRRPVTRRRPGFRDFYESPRERDRDRPFRSRYRDDEEDARPRKHPERNRERYYERGPERGRDRSLDRPKDRSNSARHQESERPLGGRANDREKEIDRPKSSPVRPKEPTEIPESTKRPNIYDRTSVAPPTTSTTSTEPPKDISHNSPDHPFRTRSRQESPTSPVRNSPNHPKPETPPARHNPVENLHEESPESDKHSPKEDPSKHHENPEGESGKQRNESEEYSSDEYYDEPEYQPAPPPPPPPPRTTVRVVKRPFLPSRGGNPNPRGLLPVGSKAPESARKEETQSSRSGPVQSAPSHPEGYRNADNEEDSPSPSSDDDKRTYDAYKFIQTDVSQKSRAEDYEGVLSRPSVGRPDDGDSRSRRPVDDNDEASKSDNDSLRNAGSRGRHQEDSRGRRPDENLDDTTRDHSDSLRTAPVGRVRNQEDPRGRRPDENLDGTTRDNSDSLRTAPVGRVRNQEETFSDKPVLKWNSDEYRQGQRGDVRHETDGISAGQSRAKPRVPVTENSGYYSDTYANENADLPSGPAGNSATNKQIINEVVTHHRLQDIPESEYDVTLNEALTPAFSTQEGNLPSGFVLPIHRQLGRDAVLQSTENSYKVSRPYNQHGQQQKAFVPSPQFLPLTDIGGGNGNERSRSVQYFRTPEAVHVTGPQYRHQRGPWHDYTGY